MKKQTKYKLKGSLQISGDKSISHRSLILSSMALGEAKITNLLESEDTLSTIKILKALSIQIKKVKEDWIVIGNGTNGYIQPSEALDCGNSGTTARLMLGAVSTNPIFCTFIGDKSLSKRPMTRVTNFLNTVGAETVLTNKDYFPMTINGVEDPLPLHHKITKASAQIKTALILAALNIMGRTSIIETRKTRDHTEILLKYLKVKFKIIKQKDNATKLVFNGPYEIEAKNIFVAGDPSSAAFFIVAALIVPNSKIILKNVCLNKTRIEYISILKKMGAKIKVEKGKTRSGELIGSIQVEYSKLKAVNIPKKLSPYLIDEYPILSIAASVAKGTTKMNGLEELRYKESDRIKSIHENLKKLKINCSVKKDDISITGSTINPNGGVKIKTFGDHRIAMSFKVMSLICDKQLSFDDLECINISYPDFNKHLNSLKVENGL